MGSVSRYQRCQCTHLNAASVPTNAPLGNAADAPAADPNRRRTTCSTRSVNACLAGLASRASLFGRHLPTCRLLACPLLPHSPASLPPFFPSSFPPSPPWCLQGLATEALHVQAKSQRQSSTRAVAAPWAHVCSAVVDTLTAYSNF